jgi:hypothetical protein
MVSSTIDHMVAVTAFLAATLIFIGLFNQTIQTAVIYQRHRATATKASDLLDSVLLNPGIPVNWGQTDVALPTVFGVQDPEFTQYRLSPYSLMRLQSSQSVYCNVTGQYQYYSNVTVGDRNFMLVPYSLALNYSTVTKLLGINNTYGFQLTLTPIVTVDVLETSASPLTLRVTATGVGFPLSHATISYCFLKVDPSGPESPTYDISFGTATADDTGLASIPIPGVAAGDSYAFIAYARAGGLVGMGYTERTSDGEYVVPFVDSMESGRVLLAHSYNVQPDGDPDVAVSYNATYVLLTEDFTLREMPIITQGGNVAYRNGSDQTYGNLTIPTHNPGILVLPYKSINGDGITLMPWGLSSLAFPVSFGGDPAKQEWVSTDMRQVMVGGIAYQAKMALWSLEGYQVVG